MAGQHEVADRSRPGDLSPIWRMLAPSDATDVATAGEPLVEILSSGNRPWQEVIHDAMLQVEESGGTLIVAVEGPVSRILLSLFARRPVSLAKTPSSSGIRAEVARRGGEIDGIYVLWPSVRAPRIAFPRGRRRVVAWAQRSGVLGGGGNRLWARVAARSALFTPLAMLMCPGLAFVIRRSSERHA